MFDMSESGMTASSGSKPVRVVRELWLEVRFQNHPDDLLQQFVRPGGDAERSLFLRALFRDVYPACRVPPIPLMAEEFDDVRDLLLRHPVHGVARDPACHG